VVSTHRSVSN